MQWHYDRNDHPIPDIPCYIVYDGDLAIACWDASGKVWYNDIFNNFIYAVDLWAYVPEEIIKKTEHTCCFWVDTNGGRCLRDKEADTIPCEGSKISDLCNFY